MSPSVAKTLPRQELVQMVALAAVVAVALAWVPWFQVLAYPFRLLLTTVHELSHGLAALATGGRFERFLINTDGSGLAYTAGGVRSVVIPAGYLGAACFGALLVWLGSRPRAGRGALIASGALMILLTLRFGLPSVWHGDVLSGLLTTAAGGSIGLLFLWVGLALPLRWVVFFVHLVAFEAALFALDDLRVLIGLSATSQAPANDALSMAELTRIPAPVWAVLWAVMAAAIIAVAVYRAWFRR
ncbi:MAG: M50 family metallopeptidase [Acidobacteriota bacterium]